MIDRKAAFLLGYLPARVGFRFNAIQLVEQLSPAEPPLLAPLGAWTKALNVGAAETVQGVLTVERLLEEAGLASAGRPQSYADYVGWAETSSERAAAAVRRDIGAFAAFHLGHNLGDLTTTVALEVMVADLVERDPSREFLRKQLASLAIDETSARDEVVLACRAVGQPASAEGVLEELAILVGMPSSDKRSLLEHLERLRGGIEDAF